MALVNPPIQELTGSIVDQAGALRPLSYDYFNRLSGLLASVIPIVNASFGVNRFALASQPTLGAGDAGYVAFVTDYAHSVYWDGAAWQWMDGDRPGRFSDFDSAPGTGWGLCDGSTYTALVIGAASLTTRNIVTPNLSGSPAYKKSAAAYTGSPVAASAPGATVSGTTGDTSAAGGVTDFENVTAPTGFFADVTVQSGAGATATHTTGTYGHRHTMSDTHHHAAGSLAATVDATGEPTHLGVLPYVRL